MLVEQSHYAFANIWYFCLVEYRPTSNCYIWKFTGYVVCNLPELLVQQHSFPIASISEWPIIAQGRIASAILPLMSTTTYLLAPPVTTPKLLSYSNLCMVTPVCKRSNFLYVIGELLLSTWLHAYLWYLVFLLCEYWVHNYIYTMHICVVLNYLSFRFTRRFFNQ